MDLHLPFPNPTIPKSSSPSTSDTDTEAPHHHHHHPPPPPPPLQTHLQKSLSLSNGGPRRGRGGDPLAMVAAAAVSYKECLKNHAAGIGGLALDGCGEFMPSPNFSPADPSSLKCAACGCHRNFHRRDSSSSAAGSHHHHHIPLPALQWTHHHRASLSPSQTSSGSPNPSSPAASPTPQQSIFPSAPHMLLALSSGSGGGGGGRNPSDSARKRARTRFTAEQKAKMRDFAERLGWRMLRGNEDKIIDDFCGGIGVRRNVFKVWMHNNKHRREKGAAAAAAAAAAANGFIPAANRDDVGDYDDEDDNDDDDKVSVKYDLNGTISGSNYEMGSRVRFDTDVFESKVHVLHGSGGAGGASSP